MAQADWSMQQHDLLPSIQATLSSGGAPVNLTGSTVKFIMAAAAGGTPRVNAAATVVDAVNGVVRYDWAVGDTATAGNFLAQWQVTDSTGKPRTFPTLTYHSIAVLADLDGA